MKKIEKNSAVEYKEKNEHKVGHFMNVVYK